MKLCLAAQVLFSPSAPQPFEILALTIDLFGNQTVVGCYQPPPASPSTSPSLVQLLSELHFNDVFQMDDFHWDWLSSVSDDFKARCLFLKLTQII